MSIVENQRRILLGFIRALRPHWRRDTAIPGRIEGLLRADRRLGSRDRRLYRELLYTTLRFLPWIEPALDADDGRAVEAVAILSADLPATRDFRAAFGAQPGDPPAGVAAKAVRVAGLLGPSAGAPLLPDWFRDECPEAFSGPDYEALASRAPLWLRLQSPDRAAVVAEFSSLGWTGTPSPALPTAIRLPPDTAVEGTEAYRSGRVEIQDIGSQLILEAAGIAAGGTWLDACAGAGGKSLQLAALLGPEGRVDALDPRPAALAQLGRRAARAGLGSVIRLPARPDESYDGVLVDAPCSGSGTWRRSPHLKWTTSPARVADCAALQLSLLTRYARHVRPGGLLIYATCSLCRSENESVAAAFLASSPGFAPAPIPGARWGTPRPPGLLLPPSTNDGDGYFVALFKR